MNGSLDIPLSATADAMLEALRHATASVAIAALRGATLLGERASMRGLAVPGRSSANGCCHLLEASGDRIALNLPRASDVEMLPALLRCEESDLGDLTAIANRIRGLDAVALTTRGRQMGLAIAREGEPQRATAALGPTAGAVELVTGRKKSVERTVPRVLDLSSLWAGPLAAHLLWLAGGEVTRVEHCRRPDAMRQGDAAFFGLLNQGKASVALDLGAVMDQQVLLKLAASSDIVIEAARPRALLQLGIDAADLCQRVPGLVWITITGHGACGDAGDWIGFGDDCGVAGGLGAAFQEVTGEAGFIGDAIADPLTGIAAALAAWTRWRSGLGGRLGIAMSEVVAQCLQTERARDRVVWERSVENWAAARGQSFPLVRRRAITAQVSAFGADTAHCLASAICAEG